MSLAEGAGSRIVYKAYSTGVITANSQPVNTSDPGASGGQVLRRVSTTLDLTKDTYQSAEIRDDRQIADYRHGIKRVTGSISGEFSPGTYWDHIEAVCRGTAAAAVTASNTDFTSVAATNATAVFTFASGDPVTIGYRVGDIIQFTNLSETLNNATNFLILGFSGASNRVVEVYPAPTEMGADSAFTMTTMGQTVSVPSSSFVSRKFAYEIYNSDIDIARLFEEVRVGGINFGLPATGMSTIEIMLMGRD